MMWDVLKVEDENTVKQLKEKFAKKPVTIEETLTLLLELNLDEYDKTQISNKTVQMSSIPDVLKRQHCAGCGKAREGNLACGGCGVVMYCGRDCQVEHWKTKHKLQCKRLKEAKEKFIK
jgi:hypothetical protein